MLEHFRVTEPGQLEVAGRWEGAQDVELDKAALVLHVRQRVDRIEAARVNPNPRSWQAAFPWDGDSAAIGRAFLEVGGRLVVEFPSQPSARRRLGRTMRPALPLQAQQPGSENGTPDDLDLVSLHADLVAAKNKLAESQEETEAAREEARRANDDVARERSRREREGVRFNDALAKVKRVAEEALRAERERYAGQDGEIARLEQALDSAHAESGTAREQVAAAAGERERIVASARAEIESAREELAGAQREIEQQQARQTQLSILLSDARAEAERVPAVEAQRDEALAAAAAAEQGVEGLRKEVAVAHRQLEELEVEVTEARRGGADAAAETARLRDRLAAIRAAVGDIS